jgi:hypothetical protein
MNILSVFAAMLVLGLLGFEEKNVSTRGGQRQKGLNSKIEDEAKDRHSKRRNTPSCKDRSLSKQPLKP